MKWLLNALTSSVGRKFVMGITGLLLCGFLVVHLAGNLLLYVGAEEYNQYAHALHKQDKLLIFAEAGLFALFAAHILIAGRLVLDNRNARKHQYAVKQSKIDSANNHKLASADLWMALSGVVILGFILVHLADMTLKIRPDFSYHGKEPYEIAMMVLGNRWSKYIYAIGTLVLTAHLSHGVSSAFQSLGINHPKYNPIIRWGGFIFAIVIGLGFMSLPLWFGFFSNGG